MTKEILFETGNKVSENKFGDDYSIVFCCKNQYFLFTHYGVDHDDPESYTTQNDFIIPLTRLQACAIKKYDLHFCVTESAKNLCPKEQSKAINEEIDYAIYG